MNNDKLYEKFDNYKTLTIDNMETVGELVIILNETLQNDNEKKEEIDRLSKKFLNTAKEQLQEYKHLLEEHSRIA